MKTVLPLVALSSGLAAAPAGALELGDLTVQSTLGQPLRASIAYALAPNEMLSNTCVAVSAGRSTGGLPGIGAHTVSITERAIVIAGDAAIREPMLGTRVTINCPYTPNLSREYMLFVDPAGVAEQQAATTAVAARPAVRAAVNDTPIGQSTRYQVRQGDTLSGIAGRIQNRSMALWPAVNAIFAANPDAFVDNDPNRLKAGSWLTIPSLDGSAPVVAAPSPGEAPVTAEAPVASDEPATTYEPAAPYEPATFEPPMESPAETIPVTDSTDDLKPGGAVDSPVATPAETIDIPDTALEGPQTTSSVPNVPTAIISTGTRSESTSTLIWLAGLGLAVIAALLLFGRRFRDWFGSTPVGAASTGQAARRADASETIHASERYDGIDDDSPTDENLALDADLVIGTGLQQGVDVDVAQDFGFAATTDLDIELPFEPEVAGPTGDTDIIPPITSNMESILESEVLPEDDDYDMSIIVDATKMPLPEDVTERDLQAVEVDTLEDDAEASDFTISQDADYDLLELDYEEELTATQALNLEIERAAAELAKDIDGTGDNEKTAAMPAADARQAEDATAELPSDGGDATMEFEASYDPNDTNAVTVNMSQEDKTTEMRVANDDETVEMDIEGGKVDTRRS